MIIRKISQYSLCVQVFLLNFCLDGMKWHIIPCSCKNKNVTNNLPERAALKHKQNMLFNFKSRQIQFELIIWRLNSQKCYPPFPTVYLKQAI